MVYQCPVWHVVLQGWFCQPFLNQASESVWKSWETEWALLVLIICVNLYSLLNVSMLWCATDWLESLDCHVFMVLSSWSLLAFTSFFNKCSFVTSQLPAFIPSQLTDAVIHLCRSFFIVLAHLACLPDGLYNVQLFHLYSFIVLVQLQYNNLWIYWNNLHHILRLSLIHIWRCRRSYACRSRWSPYH